jgi:hypothetical protein
MTIQEEGVAKRYPLFYLYTAWKDILSGRLYSRIAMLIKQVNKSIEALSLIQG